MSYQLRRERKKGWCINKLRVAIDVCSCSNKVSNTDSTLSRRKSSISFKMTSSALVHQYSWAVWSCLRNNTWQDYGFMINLNSLDMWEALFIPGGWRLTVSTHINSGLQLMQRDPATVAQHLSADVLTDRGGSYRQQINKLTSVRGLVLLWSSVMQPELTWPRCDADLPSRCRSMLVLSRFLARATSPSVTLVQRDILTEHKTRFYI